MVAVKTHIKCHACGKEAMHVVRDIVDAKDVGCPFCGGRVALALHRDRLRALAEKYRAVQDFLDI